MPRLPSPRSPLKAQPTTATLPECAKRYPKDAIAAYEKIAEDRSAGIALQDVAALRAGSLLIDQGSFDAARSRLEPLASEGRPYRYLARELLAFAAWRAGDTAGA